MNEPTIDEMLEWFGQFYVPHEPFYDYRMENAIRTILEQHRDDGLSIHGQKITKDPQIELETIRAFVERVKVKANSQLSDEASVSDGRFLQIFMATLQKELAAMEKR